MDVQILKGKTDEYQIRLKEKLKEPIENEQDLNQLAKNLATASVETYSLSEKISSETKQLSDGVNKQQLGWSAKLCRIFVFFWIILWWKLQRIINKKKYYWRQKEVKCGKIDAKSVKKGILRMNKID